MQGYFQQVKIPSDYFIKYISTGHDLKALHGQEKFFLLVERYFLSNAYSFLFVAKSFENQLMSMLIMLQLPQGDNATGILDVLKLMQDRRGSNTQVNAIEFPDFKLCLISEFKTRLETLSRPQAPKILQELLRNSKEI